MTHENTLLLNSLYFEIFNFPNCWDVKLKFNFQTFFDLPIFYLARQWLKFSLSAKYTKGRLLFQIKYHLFKYSYRWDISRSHLFTLVVLLLKLIFLEFTSPLLVRFVSNMLSLEKVSDSLRNSNCAQNLGGWYNK